MTCVMTYRNTYFSGIYLSKFNFVIQPEEPLPFSFYLGSTWRGILGWGIRSLICPFNKNRKCDQCLIKDNCPYFLLFEQNSSISGIFDTPRSYILLPTSDRNQNGRINLEVTLIGDCYRFIPVIIKSLENSERKGLGKDRIFYRISGIQELLPGDQKVDLQDMEQPMSVLHGPFDLKEWLDYSTGLDLDKSFTVRLFTPLRMRKKKQYLNKMDWQFFLQVLTRRLEALNCIFCQGSPLGKEKWQKLKEQFQALETLKEITENDSSVDLDSNPYFKPDLKWQELKRFSNTQKRKVPMGGLVGDIEMYAPWDWMGEWLKTAELLHVGKGAAMGLGKVQILG